jgi:hypothetical protein
MHSRLAVEVKGSEGEHSSHRLSSEGMIFFEKSVNTALSEIKTGESWSIMDSTLLSMALFVIKKRA